MLMTLFLLRTTSCSYFLFSPGIFGVFNSYLGFPTIPVFSREWVRQEWIAGADGIFCSGPLGRYYKGPLARGSYDTAEGDCGKKWGKTFGFEGAGIGQE